MKSDHLAHVALVEHLFGSPDVQSAGFGTSTKRASMSQLAARFEARMSTASLVVRSGLVMVMIAMAGCARRPEAVETRKSALTSCEDVVAAADATLSLTALKHNSGAKKT